MTNSTGDILSGVVSLIVGICFIAFRENIVTYISALQQKKNSQELKDDRELFVRIFIFGFSIGSLIISAILIYSALPLHNG
jgi:hypothetical protein